LLKFRLHSDIPQSVGLLQTSDRPFFLETFYLTTHNAHKEQTSIPPGGIRTHNCS